jgi:20S proteasome alpha/beta subunit
MTLVVGIIAKNGIVLASDSRATSQITSNDTVQKIVKLDNHNAVGISGDGTLGVHLLELISPDLTYEGGIVKLVEKIRELSKKQYDEYFTSQVPKERPALTFMIAGYTDKSDPRIYQLNSKDSFVPRPTSTGFNCIGVPYFADYLLNRFYQSEINMKQAQVLAAFCIMETESQSHDVGGEINVSSFSETEIFSELPPKEIKEILDKCGNFHILNKNIFYPEDISEDNLPSIDAKPKEL